MSLNRYKLPIIPEPSFRKSNEFDLPTMASYDEVIFDYRTNRYITLSQEREIYRLNDELKKQKEKAQSKLQNIVAYFYKR